MINERTIGKWDRRRILHASFIGYVVLLVYEGALRKWVFIGLSDALLLVRDPLALWILLAGAPLLQRWMGNWVSSIYILCGCMGLIALIQLMRDGGGVPQILTALYGLRTYWLHFPLVAVFAAVVTQRLFGQICWVIAVSTVIMFVVMILQYMAPGDAYLNRGAGGVEGVMLGAAHDRIRPAGTFAYSTGPSYFFPVALTIGVLGICKRRFIPRWLAWTTLLLCLMVIPISGSRTVLFLSGCVLLSAVPLLVAERDFIKNAALIIIAFSVTLLVLRATEVGKYALASFAERWIDAAELEASGSSGVTVVLVRIWDIVRGGYEIMGEVPPLGRGIGLGTNVGAYLNSGAVSFLLAEYEWARIIAECGPFFGLVVIAWRIGTGALAFSHAFKLPRAEVKVAFLFLGTVVPNIVFAHIQQATILGFVAVSLMLFFGYVALVRINMHQSRQTGAYVRHEGPRAVRP